MKSFPVIVLLVALVVPGCFPCKDGDGCIPRGGFCRVGTWTHCCCPDGCLGLIVGVCFGTTKGVNGLMAYTIKDASDNPLLRETIVLDETTAVTQEQVDKIIARFGNQTLYMDAHIDFYSQADGPSTKQSHQSVRRFKIN